MHDLISKIQSSVEHTGQSTFTDTLVLILQLLESKPAIPKGTSNGQLAQLFSNPTFDISPGDEEALFYEVNKMLDAVFGIDNKDKYVVGGCYGLELVVAYLDVARRHIAWDKNAEALIMLKLHRIMKFLRGMEPFSVPSPISI